MNKINNIVNRYINNDIVDFDSIYSECEKIFSQQSSEKVIFIPQYKGIGDFVLLTSFLKNIKVYFPTYKILFSCYESIKEIAEKCSYIDEIITVPNDLAKRSSQEV